MKSLDLMRLEGLREWQVVAERLELEAVANSEFAADADKLEKVFY